VALKDVPILIGSIVIVLGGKLSLSTPYDVNVQELEMLKVLLMLRRLFGVAFFGTKLQTSLEKVARSFKESDYYKFS